PGLSSVPTAIGRVSPAGPGPPSGTGWSGPRRPPLLPVVEVLRVGQREQPHRLARPHLGTAHAVALPPVGPRMPYPPRADPVMPGEPAPLRLTPGHHSRRGPARVVLGLAAVHRLGRGPGALLGALVGGGRPAPVGQHRHLASGADVVGVPRLGGGVAGVLFVLVEARAQELDDLGHWDSCCLVRRWARRTASAAAGLVIRRMVSRVRSVALTMSVWVQPSSAAARIAASRSALASLSWASSPRHLWV